MFTVLVLVLVRVYAYYYPVYTVLYSTVYTDVYCTGACTHSRKPSLFSHLRVVVASSSRLDEKKTLVLNTRFTRIPSGPLITHLGLYISLYEIILTHLDPENKKKNN